MKYYIVGGAVRDELLGQEVHDRDWVVVGANPADMEALGFTPVGAEFPVFLHPKTNEEYALARTERSTGAGYRTFQVHSAPDVTLEQDLQRRDLTINAIARDADGLIIDPWGGVADLEARTFRHVSAAFVEDPVRILRLARLAAKFPDFRIADETRTLLVDMVRSGEVDALVPERVWKEVSRGLMEQQPSRMFDVLRSCGALARLFPEIDRLWGVPQRADHHPEVDTGVHLMMVLDTAARLAAPLEVRYACLCHDLGKGTTPVDLLPRHIGHEQRSVQLSRALSARLRVSNECSALAEAVAREHGNVHRSAEFGAAALLRLLERCDALRRPDRFDRLLLACECDARGRGGRADAAYEQRPRLRRVLDIARAVDTAEIASRLQVRGASGTAIGDAIRQARVDAIAAALDPARSAEPNADR